MASLLTSYIIFFPLSFFQTPFFKIRLKLFSVSLIFILIHSLFFFFIFSLNKIEHKTILDEPIPMSMLFSSCIVRSVSSSIVVDFSPLHLSAWLLLSIDCSSLKYAGEINGPRSSVIILNLFWFQLGILWENWKRWRRATTKCLLSTRYKFLINLDSQIS